MATIPRIDLKIHCRECSGSSFCQHNKDKYHCKECGTEKLCEHNKSKSKCKECGGKSICIHGKQKHVCFECGGSSICEHNKRKSNCRICGNGKNFCEHDKYKNTCVDCGGIYICPHKKRKNVCKECKGASICEHNKIKRECKDCSIGKYLVILQRQSLRRILQNSNEVKNKHSIEYLGCDSESFLQHIKRKMTEDMTFDNIHIDHIKPVSKFDLNNHDDFLACCHYSNLQPLLVEVNLSKNNKWTEENEQFWKEHIIYKEYDKIYLTI